MSIKLRHKTSPSIVPDHAEARGLSKAELSLAVRSHQARIMLRASKANLIGSMSIAFIISIALSKSVAYDVIATWCLFVFLVLVARLALSNYELRTGFWQTFPDISLRRNVIGSGITGFVIGLICYSLEDPRLHFEHAVVVATLAIAATTAVAVSMAYERSAQAFGTGILAVPLVKLMYLGTLDTHAMVITILLMLGHNHYVSIKVSRMYVRGLKDRLNAEALANELESVNRDLKFHATHDSLTGLPNRGAFHNEMAVAAYSLDGVGRELILALLDLDGFKAVNDTLGHGAGDELLRQVAQRLNSIFEKDSATIARLGGDEFALIIPFESMDQLKRVSSSIVTRLSHPFSVHGARVTIGASVGVQRFRRGCQNPDALLHHADIALYQAKNTGRGKWVMSHALDASEGGKVLNQPRFRQKTRV